MPPQQGPRNVTPPAPTLWQSPSLCQALPSPSIHGQEQAMPSKRRPSSTLARGRGALQTQAPGWELVWERGAEK